MTDVILSASNLSVGFHGRKRRALLQGLTLTLSPERLSCLIGRNGVGNGFDVNSFHEGYKKRGFPRPEPGIRARPIRVRL